MGHAVYSPHPAPSHFLTFEPLKKNLAGKLFANRRRREASCYLLAADTWQRFILRQDTSLVYHLGCNSSIWTANTRRSDVYHLLIMCHIYSYIRVTTRHHCLLNYIWNTFFVQGVPGVKVTTSGFNSRADSESKTSYTHGSSSQPFRNYILKYSK